MQKMSIHQWVKFLGKMFLISNKMFPPTPTIGAARRSAAVTDARGIQYRVSNRQSWRPDPGPRPAPAAQKTFRHGQAHHVVLGAAWHPL